MKFFWMAILGICILSGCRDSEKGYGDVHAAREFYRQSVVDQQKIFRQLSLKDQLNLFFFGNQVRHPPALYLAQCFALNGESAVELLRARLSEDNDDLTVRDVAMLLATIDAMGKYDVAGDPKLMALLKRQIVRMRDDGWRDTAERKMNSIGKERSETASQAPECG
jgi:hypothetical protein